MIDPEEIMQTPEKAAKEVRMEVDNAADSVSHAADALREAATKADGERAASYDDLLQELRNIHATLKEQNDKHAAPAKEAVDKAEDVAEEAADALPEPEAEVEPPPKRKIRRGRRVIYR